ncbi:oxidoreductase [Actinacidiphila glaucinigra]|uniref:oxidoreductase n=1 Tax=Actinacidiphila glaucinigra TaxID=235986 RepID=UPI003D8B7076
MDLKLHNKVAVVTGASRGIGLAAVRSLVAEGATVVAGSRRGAAALDELAGQNVVSVNGDLTTVEGVQTLIRTAEERFGGVDVLVNNIGILTPRLSGFLSVTDEDFITTFNANVLSAIRAARAALPSLIERKGSIITISSVNAFLPDPSIIDYTVSKAALTNFSKALSKEVGPQGVRVNTISPGPVETDMWVGEGGMAETVGNAMGVDKDTAREQIVDSIGGFATGRFTRPEEVGDLVAMLASDRAGNITGADFTIDGGLIKTL